jgi:threonine dehydratase
VKSVVDAEAPTLADIRAAVERLRGHAVRTPLLQFDSDPQVWLKLENLQPIGSFKLRGALNRMRSLGASDLADGVFTASAGNMAQGVAYAARLLGVPASVVVPDGAPATKLEAIERLGASILKVPYEEWWDTMRTRKREGMRGVFVHPFADVDVMAGNGTIALEVLEDLPDVDTILVPWGGGGLACGIAAAVRALNPSVRVYACEVEGAAPLTASLAAGAPVAIENRKSFIDGIGGRGVFPEMWPLAQSLVSGAFTTSVADVATAVRLLAQRARVVAEGAGATPVAIARAGLAGVSPRPRRVACIVSGGNIDASVLAGILADKSP